MSAPGQADTPLVVAVPSKGRLQENAAAFFARAGLEFVQGRGARDYRGAIAGLPGAEVAFLSASEIVGQLAAGAAHFGVTGEDLVREQVADADNRLLLLAPLGFGRANVVVAAPQAWIDVRNMADLEDVAASFHVKRGARMRVATKYVNLTRRFFASHGVGDYRIVESLGATEGAPAAGGAELIVDITTTGATLAANGLKALADGLILKSQAHLAAGLGAPWDEAQRAACRRLLTIFQARARGKTIASLTWPGAQDALARAVAAPFAADPIAVGAHRMLIPKSSLFAATLALASAGVGPVSVEQPAYVFEAECPPADRLAAAVGAK